MTTVLKVWQTPTARRKLKEIYRYSCKKWGREVAKEYLADMAQAIKKAATEAGGKKKNAEFSTRFSYSLARRHYIFFEVREDKLVVATIFHTAMQVKERLVEESAVIDREIDKLEN